VKIKKTPIRDGINKLIIQRTNVAEKIPTVLVETKPKRNKATEPLTPISVIAIVGITEITNNIDIISIIASAYSICTSNNCKRMKN